MSDKEQVDGPERAINYMPIKQFMDDGYLQELNRRFLHPLGLALEVVVEDNGECYLGGVWDYSDDPEGMRFGDGMLDYEKYRKVEMAFAAKQQLREAALGYVRQPPPPDPAQS